MRARTLRTADGSTVTRLRRVPMHCLARMSKSDTSIALRKLLAFSDKHRHASAKFGQLCLIPSSPTSDAMRKSGNTHPSPLRAWERLW